LLVLAIFSLSGCNKTTTTVEFPQDGRTYGAVMFDNGPIVAGTITFVDKEGDQEYPAMITDGRYEVHVPAGPKMVRITSDQQNIPERYNTKTTLSCTISDMGGPLDFEMMK